MKSFVCASLWAAAALACGTADPTGLGEPIVVRGGTFEEGGVPGSDPPAEGQDPVGPHVTIVESANNVLRPGQVGKRLSGRATDDAVAIAVALDGEGTGYWVIPTAAPDPAAPGELTWGMAVDVGYDVSPGLHTLLIAAVDAEGRAGSQFAQPVCVRSEVPDGLHACDPSSAPPAGVLSLGWDTNVDLDLLVFTPQGKWVDPKHPSTAIATDDGIEPGPGDGEIDHDGLPIARLSVPVARTSSSRRSLRPGPITSS